MEHKKIIEWFNLLPPVLRKLALENIKKGNGEIIENSLGGALDSAFTWYRTPQESGFWRFLYDHLRFNDNKFDPTICTTELLNSLRKDGVVVKDYYVNYVHKPIIEYL
jgi:hypothetical protein